ncbi:hypothetical protein XTGART2_2645 [Xanthomonas translucens pv. graminis]|jgi:hypothetical protein|nr:putative peptide [Xanthomonas translucens pv. graminis ART-Xtg29]SBV43270.1 hypothetical protein XTGART2_2645 [Xanthomonas translucens pv. graminis]SBV48007.1 hypothetical protein XTGART29_2661 [Xanthomonas translucens pv. graminis ART-Xtg29]SBV59435.1 hypothetical protein XTGICMP6431_2625 [Xanthomonas translucens pv. graminis]
MSATGLSHDARVAVLVDWDNVPTEPELAHRRYRFLTAY